MTGRSRLAFIIRSETLTGAQISRQLGLPAMSVVDKGAPISRRDPGSGPRRWTTWELAGGLPDDADPNRHLEALLPLLESRITELRQVQAAGATTFWSLFVTATPTGNMLWFEPAVLARLAEIGAALEFDIYDSDGE